MSGGKKENRRQRNWVFIVYPESAPEDWRDRLDEFRIPWVESPLHDMDINPGTGEIKKPHWHICLVADGVKSFEQICEITGSVNGTFPQPVFSLRGQIRYFAHLDNPEKHQYSVDSIIAHMGADLEAYLMPTRSQRYRYIADMLQWCRDNDIIEFQDLMDYAMADRMEDWFPLLCDSCAIVVSNYLKSSRNRRILKEKYDIED